MPTKNDMPQTKPLGKLNAIKNNLILVYAAIDLFTKEDAYTHLGDGIRISNGEKHLDFSFEELDDILGGNPNKNEFMLEFEKMGIRAFISNTFQVIQTYCEDTNQTEKFKSQDFYQFFRIIRNCVNHNFRFYLDKDIAYRQHIFPVSWRDKTIEISMNGDELRSYLFSRVDAFLLHEDMREFAELELD